MSIYPEGLVEKALMHMHKAEHVIPTGYDAIDKKLGGGLQKGHLYVLAGRPGIGKTNLALNIMEKVMLLHKKKVLYYSYQLDPETVIRRMIKITSHGNEKFYQESADDIRGFNFIIYTDTNINMIGKTIDKDADYSDIDLIVIDDLQHISTNPYYKVKGECERIKEIAEERNIPILVISNLNKDVEEKFVTDRPIIPDLSGSRYGDSAAQYSDVIMFLYKDEYYNPETEEKGIAEIIIAKNSTGPSGTCELAYLPEIMMYETLVRK